MSQVGEVLIPLTTAPLYGTWRGKQIGHADGTGGSRGKGLNEPRGL